MGKDLECGVVAWGLPCQNDTSGESKQAAFAFSAFQLSVWERLKQLEATNCIAAERTPCHLPNGRADCCLPTYYQYLATTLAKYPPYILLPSAVERRCIRHLPDTGKCK